MSITICGKPVGRLRICTLLPGHETPCSGNAPEATKEVETVSIEMLLIVFQLGLLLRSYDPRHFRSQTHCNEVIDFHFVRRLGLNLTDKQLELCQQIVFRYFNS